MERGQYCSHPLVPSHVFNVFCNSRRREKGRHRIKSFYVSKELPIGRNQNQGDDNQLSHPIAGMAGSIRREFGSLAKTSLYQGLFLYNSILVMAEQPFAFLFDNYVGFQLPFFVMAHSLG